MHVGCATVTLHVALCTDVARATHDGGARMQTPESCAAPEPPPVVAVAAHVGGATEHVALAALTAVALAVHVGPATVAATLAFVTVVAVAAHVGPETVAAPVSCAGSVPKKNDSNALRSGDGTPTEYHSAPKIKG